MRIQDIMEAISSGDLTIKSQRTIIELIDEFGRTKQAELAASLGVSDIYDNMIAALAAYKEESNDRNMDRLDKYLGQLRKAAQSPTRSVIPVINNFRNKLSDALTKIVIDRVENDFGKIEPITDPSDLDGNNNNLWWLEAIAVEIRDTSETSGFDNSSPQISPDQVKKIDMPVEIPPDPRFRNAIESSPDAELTDDGILIDLVRFQKQEQVGGIALRTGVFYLPKSSSSTKHYRNTGDSRKNYYGGSVKTEGKSLFKKPLAVMAGTGGKVPVKAYEEVRGKGAYAKLQKATRSILASHARQGGNEIYKLVDQYLDTFGGNRDLTSEIIEYSRHGNQLYYALTEHVIVHAVRDAGYDSIIGFWKSKNRYMITEVVDLREVENPIPGEEGTLHPKFESSDGNVVDAISEAGGGFFNASVSRAMVNSHSRSRMKQDSLISLIVIYADDIELWNVLSNAVIYQIEETAFGESYSAQDTLYDDHQIVREIVETFVHETVHLIQNTRAMISRQSKSKDAKHQKYGPNTKVYIPDTTKKRPTPKIAGKRGQNASDPINKYIDGGSAPSVDEWIAYLSHDIEIDAHASSIAATLYQNYFNHSYGKMGRTGESNEAVDSAINDIRYNDEMVGNSYYNHYIVPEIQRIKKAGIQSNRDKRLIQVWNRLRKKIIQHLEDYRQSTAI